MQMLPFIFAVSVINVCPVDTPLECCITCQANYFVCKDRSDSLSEELGCLRQKNKCHSECPVDYDDEDDAPQ